MNAARWVGRILGVLLVAVFLIFMIGQGFNPLKMTGTEITLSSFVLIALAGMLVAWRSELLGGAIEYVVHKCGVGDDPKLIIHRHHTCGNAKVVFREIDDLPRLSVVEAARIKERSPSLLLVGR